MVLCLYKGEGYIRQQLLSLAGQSRPPDEIIVYSDASPDSTLQIAMASREAFTETVTVFVSGLQNVGSSKAYLYAASLATGDVIFFCDQDDFWLPAKTDQVMSVLEAEDNVTVVTHDLWVCNEQLLVREKYSRLWGSSRFGLGRNSTFSHGCALAVRRDALTCVDEPSAAAIGHDKACFLAARALGEARFLAEPLVLYRRHGSNVSADPLVNPLSSKQRWFPVIKSEEVRVERARITKELIFLRDIDERQRLSSQSKGTHFCDASSVRGSPTDSWLRGRITYLSLRAELRNSYLFEGTKIPSLYCIFKSMGSKDISPISGLKDLALYLIVLIRRVLRAIG